VISESGWHQKTWVLQRRHEQVSFEYDGGDLIGFLEDHDIVNYSNQARVNKRCANRLSSSEIENRMNASKISNVIETSSRNRRDLVSKGKIGIKNKTKMRAEAEGRTETPLLRQSAGLCILSS